MNQRTKGSLNMTQNDDNPFGLLIPIGVLLIAMLFTGVPWLLIPIFVLGVIFVSGVAQNRRIQSRKSEYDHWKTPESGTYTSGYTPEATKPIYDQKKQTDEGITCGTLIPIIFVGWLLLETMSWVFLIPLFCLIASTFDAATKRSRGKSKVWDQLVMKETRTVQDIADTTGMNEERVRQQIVDEKRSGHADVWFDPSSGQVTRKPIQIVEPAHADRGCSYCGFALRSEDRFCPYCGAPIKT